MSAGAGANKVLTTNASGVATWQAAAGSSAAGETGEVQFNDGGVFAATSTFFWDNTNARLGIATTTPSQTLHVEGPGKFSGALDMTSQKITNLATPTADADAATKAYVDALGGADSFTYYYSSTVNVCACPSGFTALSQQVHSAAPTGKPFFGTMEPYTYAYVCMCYK